jgi:chromosome segregation ATPase
MEMMMDRAKVIEELERQLETTREQLARESSNARQFAKEARTQASRVSELQLEIEVLLREVAEWRATLPWLL